ncbi:MAG: WYL domain-containing protein [Dethiobacter sp.]|nr:WYL domain-containing protein [Dethiobacter sp.]
MPDGSLEVSFLLSGAQEMIPWLMTWGSTIEPLEPQWLRQALAEQLAKALEIYHT